jgi:formate dehydrogenase subunit gamma
MLQVNARRFGALILGAALALPLTTLAQAPAASPTPPVTAPVKGEPKPAAPAVEQPKVSSPPVAGKGSTAVPGWNNPPASWDSASEKPQYASVPGREMNRLIQASGREWRAFRNGPLTQYGGWLLVVVLAAIALFYLVKGPIKLHGRPTGRLIERFNAVERASHWTMAISFVFLALTGIIILWGKYIILPWLGYTGFSWLTILAKNVHNFVGPLFIFSLVVSFLIFVKDNLIRAIDIEWLTKLGGMLSGKEIPSGRFNGGEKAWFWGGLVFLGALVSVSGLILDFPNWNQGRELMQQANVVHAICAILFMAASMGHIYIGTVGMEGAYRAMRDGYVDEEWAREHHALWYEEVKQGKRPEKIVGAAQPATGD